ncbi:MAG: DUF1836 domain-containing protein [Turicibacter sp.]
MNEYNSEQALQEILDFHCPRYHELPAISLYKDQVILFIEETLKPLNLDSNEKLLTPTMLNNYVKQKVVSPPLNRRYNEKHLAYIIVVCLLKQVYSLTDICDLIHTQIGTYPIDEAYDLFCTELEQSLQSVFSTRDSITTHSPEQLTLTIELVQSAATTVAHKLFIQKYLFDKRNEVSQ